MAKEAKDLSFDERQAIMDKYNSGDPELKAKAIEEMVSALDEYVYYMIHKRFAGYVSMIEDLAQSGRLAIIEHMSDYNPQYKLTTFFSFHIQNALQDIVNGENGESHYYAESKNIITKTIRSLGMDLENIDEQVLAMHLNMTPSRLHSILEKTLYKKKIELIEEDGETSREYFDSPETAFMRSEMQKEFRQCLDELDEVENAVLCMRFGFYHPVFNQECIAYKLSDVQTKLNNAGYEANALNEYRSARRHITDIMYKNGVVGKRNKYQSAKEEIGLKFKDEDTATELFNALNDIDISEDLDE